MDIIKSRDLIVDEDPLLKKCNKNIQKMLKNRDPILFMPNDVNIIYDYGFCISISGVFLSGIKAHLIIKKIKLYFDVMVPDIDVETFNETLDDILRNKVLCAGEIEYETIYQKPLIGYNEYEKPYIRCTFSTVKERTRAIKYLQDKYTTSDDDSTKNLYKLIFRNKNISVCSWMIVKNYNYKYEHDHILYVTMDNIESSINPITGDTHKELGEMINNELYIKDRTLLVTFDIETYSHINNIPPVGTDENDLVFMICMTLHWKDSTTPIQSVCITTLETEGSRHFDTLLCESEEQVILTFIEILTKWSPDICTGFNDLKYDWVFLLAKMKIYGIEDKLNRIYTPQQAKKTSINYVYMSREHDIKISADTNHRVNLLKIPGMVCMDVRIPLMMLHPAMERTSLKAFLNISGLGGKVDMSIEEMRRHFKNKDIKGMTDVGYYCYIDALRCQELNIKHNILNEKREMGELSYTSLFDCIYYASGSKVCNIVYGYANNFKGVRYAVSTINKKIERVKYPGALVIDPETGIDNIDPTAALDFASMYPSIIRVNNMSPELCIIAKKQKKIIQHNLNHIRFDDKEGWFIAHNNKEENVGIFPTILASLFNKRAAVKKELKDIENKLKIKHDDNLEFLRVKLNSKQRAMKIFMNTFYGETGRASSPLFLIQIAGGITSLGQSYLKAVKKFVCDKGFRIKYGDTDSLYINLPFGYDADIKQSDKLTMCKEKVNITIATVKKLEKEVNDYLKKINNGCDILRMAYEETLFPSVFLSKKKYYGIPHVNTANFDADVFIRGIDIVKRGQCELVKCVGKDIIKRSLELDIKSTMLEIVESVILEYISKDDLSMENFIMTARYKPKVNNIAITTFYNRLRKYKKENSSFILPEPGEGFTYIIAEKPTVTLDGYKIVQKKGNKMELYSYAKENDIKIDKVYYFTNLVIGLCTRFISFEFSDTTISDIKMRDNNSIKTARSYLTKYIKNISADELTPQAHKKIFKTVKKEIDSRITGGYPQFTNESNVLNYKILESTPTYINDITTSISNSTINSVNLVPVSIDAKHFDLCSQRASNIILINIEKDIDKRIKLLLDEITTIQDKYDFSTIVKKYRNELEQGIKTFPNYNFDGLKDIFTSDILLAIANIYRNILSIIYMKMLLTVSVKYYNLSKC